MAAVERSRCQAIGAYLRNRIKESPLKVRQKPDSAPKHFITLNQIKPILERGPIDQLLYCLCEKCQEYSGFSADERRSRFRNDELEEKYFTVFALLLTEHCAGLIWEFHKREITLGPQRIYNEQLEFLEDLVGSLFTHHEVTDVRDRILKHQFIFFAQPLETRNTEKEIAPEEALPIDEEESPIGEGGFGKVYAFKILEEYKGAGYKDLDTDKFARKIFEANKKTSGLDEWCNLMRIYNLLDKPHPHLIETMGAFQYGDTFSIIFPRADKSLEQYLKTEASYPSEYIWEQMQGIIEGLAYLHGLPNDDVENSSKDGKKKQKKDSTFMALHLDLKPDNILIVKGRMQIADFGLSQVKDRLSLEQSKNSSNIPGNAGGYMAYAPPEYPRLAKNPHAGHDLWSMAAILSEMATHDIGPTDAEANEGQAPVELYREKRRLEEDKGYYRSWSFHYDDKLKQSVRIQHDKLLQAAQNTESRGENELWQSFFYRADFFGLIEQMLAKDRTERGTARDVADALEILLTDTKRNMKNKLSHMRIPPRDTLTIWDEAESHKLQKDYGKPEDVHFL
ncbi:hypothetical protein MMC07_001068 [Pseudocyphellaria aurata]|nr:hypothetical protein [Pseudocyphellaria aurata]